MGRDEIIEFLAELKEDSSVNKTMRGLIDTVVGHLREGTDLGKDKALSEIEEMMNGNTIDPYLRGQIWNVLSMIESL
jgi:uncharacterized protein (UPF0147 family)